MPQQPKPAMPCPVWPATRSWALHDAAASRAAERSAAAALPPHTLMARAGLAAARLAMAIAPHARRIDICCGPGNNGGDGLVAATHLQAFGRETRAWLVGAAERLPPDAADALQRARAAGVHIEAGPPARLEADLLVDALLGLGARGIDDGPLAQAVASLHAARKPVLAVDLPSGLDGDTGHVPGRVAVRADHTIALLSLKPGLFTAQGRELAGRVWFDDLGAAPDDGAACAWLAGADAARARPALRHHAQHKGSFGNVIVIGGAPGMVGAAMLAGRAALAAGAGRVFVAPLGGVAGLDAARPELMLRAPDSLLRPAVLADATVVCGCGGGDALREPLPPVLHHAARLVLDADGLNTVAAEPALARALRERERRGLATVLTPHPLEAARLLGAGTADVQQHRVRAALALAERFAAVVALKGSGTVIAAPGTTPRINASGNARLASAGTGDVLAGWLGGLWAQHAADAATAFDAATSAVWLHGRAAERESGQHALLAADLIDAMVRATDALSSGAA
ncbi:MAG: NAD(P)H-hydrate dehydratase [Burkholderiaceae bacterium]